jgi:hypothetical protein
MRRGVDARVVGGREFNSRHLHWVGFAASSEPRGMMNNRRYSISTFRGTLGTTNSLRHALRLATMTRGFPTLDDTRPDPKYRWLKDKITAAKE